jgi:hypothetical protein
MESLYTEISVDLKNSLTRLALCSSSPAAVAGDYDQTEGKSQWKFHDSSDYKQLSQLL